MNCKGKEGKKKTRKKGIGEKQERNKGRRKTGKKTAEKRERARGIPRKA